MSVYFRPSGGNELGAFILKSLYRQGTHVVVLSDRASFVGLGLL